MSQNEKYFEGFKGSTCKFTWNGRKYHIVGRYGGHKWHGFWLKVWMHEKHSLSVQVMARNRLGSDNQESNNSHNHVRDKTKLTGA